MGLGWGQRKGLGSRAMRIWLFRKSAPQWGALLPTHWFSGWENSKLPDANAPSAGAAIRAGCGLERRD